MSNHDYSENALVEQTAEQQFAALGWDVVRETWGPDKQSSLGRETRRDVVLRPRLRAALVRLNPALPGEAITQAVDELTRERAALSSVLANREVWNLLRDGVPVQVRDAHGEQRSVVVRVIDWQQPQANDYCYVSQLRIKGDLYERRPDGVGFVNGLPLVLAEYKAVGVELREAYDHNLSDYRDTIPHLFPYNALVILSNGIRSRVGSLSAGWEHFSEWKRVEREDEQVNTSIETLLRGTCAPQRLLDLVQNFTLFVSAGSRPMKLVARNHQYLGVNNAIAALQRLDEERRRLGVFWHTQGSGKSYSMVFFSQKVLRTVPGNWTFVIITDRQELDRQIYQTFADADAITEPETAVRADSGVHLRQLLRENHRNLFTLIQKFNTNTPGVSGAPGAQGTGDEPFPVLSERSDIIVMTDEAHRSQYATLAANMRRALPNAAFIGFTGTPLMVGDGGEKTRDVFGDYVSVYNFRDSVEDHATVPLFYENRIPELQIVNDDLDADMQRLIDDAALDPDQEERLEREFRRQYQLITRDERLETIAADIVKHYVGQLQGGDPGKALVVSLDKATAVRMYDNVQRHWTAQLDALRAAVRMAAQEEGERTNLQRVLTFMEATDMAVVVSSGQNEIQLFRDKGLDILTHRKRMEQEPLADRFKDPEDPLRIVFVCAMWITGFDVQSLRTVYLDKPMRNHTLMQTIARANRVYPGKPNGLIVDYIGVFRDLQAALAIYGSASGGGVGEGDTPVRDKAALVEALQAQVAEMQTFCRQHQIDLAGIIASSGQVRLQRLSQALDTLLARDDTRRNFVHIARGVLAAERAVLPDAAAETFRPQVAALTRLIQMVQAEVGKPDISGVLDDIDDLLDASIAAEEYVIRDGVGGYNAGVVDLSRINFDALQRLIDNGTPHTAAFKLRRALEERIEAMVSRNPTRMDYLDAFRKMVDDYNASSQNVQLFFEQLLEFSRTLDADEQRLISQGLDEEVGAIFDLLTRPDPGLSAEEEATIRGVARTLLERLKQEQLVLDWRRKQQSRAGVRVTIELELDQGLPTIYSNEDFQGRCSAVYQHVFEAYENARVSRFGTAA